MILPNLFIAEISMFVIQPIAVDRTVQHVTAVQLKGAKDMNPRILRQSVASVGPAGMLLADDAAMYERNLDGVRAPTSDWLLLRRGLSREYLDDDGLVVSNNTDETSQRHFWKHYEHLMSERDRAGVLR
jgi:fatty-acyl-CoA synthase